MKNILIIGCGLIGSSVLRAVHFKKLSKNQNIPSLIFFVYLEKKQYFYVIQRK
jgi:predicted dinucleotide-utilizing enzyme